MVGLRALFAHFKKMSNYFIASTLVLAAGIVLGYGYSEQFDALLESQLQGLKELAKVIADKDNAMLWMFGFIFLNNAVKSVLVVFSGVFFGVLPLAFLVLNGMVVGYLAELQMNAGQMELFLKGILPHGVIEIPAIVIACAYGIKFGSIVTKGMIGLVSVRMREVFRAELQSFLNILVPLIGLLVVSLFVAAIIESTITPWLMGL